MKDIVKILALKWSARKLRWYDLWLNEKSNTRKKSAFKNEYLLTPWCRVLLEKLIGLQLVKFPAFHGTRRFVTALTSVRHLSLSWAIPIQSIYPHPTSWRSVLISTHLRLGLPSGLLPSGFLTKTLYTPLSSPIRATCPAHLILLDFITRTILGEEYKSFSSSLGNLLHPPHYLVPPRSKYSPQHPVLKHTQLPFLPQCQRPSFTRIQLFFWVGGLVG